LEYPSPNGYSTLVKLLEDKYQSPVIVTNGAKQALGASFYMLHKLGYEYVAMKEPYWALLPQLAEAHGLCPVFEEEGEALDSEDPFLLLAPNNPDGSCKPLSKLEKLSKLYQEVKLPFIHDAVYYTHSYLPSSYKLGKFGDLQIYSASKMYGLSGLRVGWIVCHNTEYYKTLCEYIEMMTVGVSVASQRIMANIVAHEKLYGSSNFEESNFQALQKARQLFKTVNSDIIELPENFENTPGMFAWVKLKDRDALNKAKINAIDGALFGSPGYIRMNLALPPDTLREVVNRLNSL
jgi:aspartate/methionine/tyrosine aminotransferase